MSTIFQRNCSISAHSEFGDRNISKIRDGFTLIELLVVIGIVLLLAGLILPTLGPAKEEARRTACRNNLHQFSLVLHLYANDSSDFLPPGYSDAGEEALVFGGLRVTPVTLDEHVPVIARTTRTNLLRLAGGNQRILVCPGLGEPFTKKGGYRYPECGIVIGYNYLGGHGGTPWKPPSFSLSTWMSPRKLSSDPQLPLIADLNTWAPSQRATFVPHSATGSKIIGGLTLGLRNTIPFPLTAVAPDGYMPRAFGAEGGNVARLDGSVAWKKMRDMKVYTGSRTYGQLGALAAW
jgi:prepilin-type N-terminal cleavage/methylation domain-containing protein